MPALSSRSDVRLDVGVGESLSRSAPEPDTPFRIAVIGDFRGRGSRGLMRTGRELASERPIIVDRDNFDEVMAGLDVQVHLPEAGDIRFRELEDFHPDRLYSEVPYFQRVRAAAQQLSSLPVTFPSPPPPRPPTPAPGLESGNLLDLAVEATERGASGPAPSSRDSLRAWLDAQVAPHLESKTSNRVADLRSVVADTAAAQMRAVLHFPSFQQLEALWRALDLLVRGVETSGILTLHLIDVSKQELIADLNGASDPHESAIWRLLAESAGETPFALLLGAYGFSASEEDLRLLAGLGAVASGIGAPWISDADPSLVGCGSFARTPDPDDWTSKPDEAWQALRQLPVAAWIGLALPRLLLRLPYGKETDPCERMALEEMAEIPEHNRYLWGSAALACGCLLANSFSARGWELRPGDHREIDGLPLHSYPTDGEPCIQSPAEAWLTDRAAERVLECGLMPLVAPRNTDSVRVVRFQSIADPVAPLAGRWERS